MLNALVSKLLPAGPSRVVRCDSAERTEEVALYKAETHRILLKVMIFATNPPPAATTVEGAMTIVSS